jgi:hypothetical protein
LPTGTIELPDCQISPTLQWSRPLNGRMIKHRLRFRAAARVTAMEPTDGWAGWRVDNVDIVWASDPPQWSRPENGRVTLSGEAYEDIIRLLQWGRPVIGRVTLA